MTSGSGKQLWGQDRFFWWWQRVPSTWAWLLCPREAWKSEAEGRVGFVCGWALANRRVQEFFSGSHTQFEHGALAFLLDLAVSHPFLEVTPSGWEL